MAAICTCGTRFTGLHVSGKGTCKSAETTTDITDEELRPSILSRRCSTIGRRPGRCQLDDLLDFAVRRDPARGRCPMTILLVRNVVIHNLVGPSGLW
jgi:hypothetical protein